MSMRPIADVLEEELRTMQEGGCLWCKRGLDHPAYSLCPHRADRLDFLGGAEVSAVARCRLARSPLPPTPAEPIRFGADNAFTLMAATEEEDRLKCWNLVYKEYLAHGYTQEKEIPYRYSVHDALPNTATFLIRKDRCPAGTVTVYPDSPIGLPADEIYRAEIDALRREGRRPVEVGRLTIGREYINDRHILTTLFDILSLYARCLRKATDLVITVNPTHVKFYEKMLLFERIGEGKDLGSVCGAPAVLLRLDLERQRQVIRWTHGEGPMPAGFDGAKTFYRYFSDLPAERARVAWLRRSLRVPDEAFLRRYFVLLRPLIPGLSREQRHFVRNVYPDYDLEPHGT